MYKEVTLTVPQFIYDIYAEAAKDLIDSGYTIERVMSVALHAYAQHLFEEMIADGTINEASENNK